MKLIKRFIKDERGLEASEYALLLALICIGVVTVITLLVTEIKLTFTKATTAMATANAQP